MRTLCTLGMELDVKDSTVSKLRHPPKHYSPKADQISSDQTTAHSRCMRKEHGLLTVQQRNFDSLLRLRLVQSWCVTFLSCVLVVWTPRRLVLHTGRMSCICKVTV